MVPRAERCVNRGLVEPRQPRLQVGQQGLGVAGLGRVHVGKDVLHGGVIGHLAVGLVLAVDAVEERQVQGLGPDSARSGQVLLAAHGHRVLRRCPSAP